MILMTAEPTGDWNAKLLNPNNDSAKLNKLKGQKGGTVSPVRSSKRTAATSDQDSVEKATKLKARHNLEIANDKGKNPLTLSFISRDDTSLLLSVNSIGVRLGDDSAQIHNSLENLRNLELQHIAEFKTIDTSNKEILDDASACSFEDSLDLDALNLICSEIAEGLGDGGCDPKGLQTPLSSVKGSRKKNRKSQSRSQ